MTQSYQPPISKLSLDFLKKVKTEYHFAICHLPVLATFPYLSTYRCFAAWQNHLITVLFCMQKGVPCAFPNPLRRSLHHSTRPLVHPPNIALDTAFTPASLWNDSTFSRHCASQHTCMEPTSQTHPHRYRRRRQCAISGETIVVGATGDDDNGPGSGSAYVFVRSNGTWTETAKLIASDGTDSDTFGRAVALDGNTILVGATDAAINNTLHAGAIYAFTYDGTTWIEQAKLTASDAGAYDRFGYAVAIDGDTALVGAHQDNDERTSQTDGTIWNENALLTQNDGAPNDQFGFSLALDGGTALVGAYWHDAVHASTGLRFSTALIASGASEHESKQP